MNLLPITVSDKYEETQHFKECGLINASHTKHSPCGHRYTSLSPSTLWLSEMWEWICCHQHLGQHPSSSAFCNKTAPKAICAINIYYDYILHCHIHCYHPV